MERVRKNDSDYTIPRNNRELQHQWCWSSCCFYYTIPRNNRELQQWEDLTAKV